MAEAVPRLDGLFDLRLLERLSRVAAQLRPIKRRPEVRMPEDEILVAVAESCVPLLLERRRRRRMRSAFAASLRWCS
jgi:hypothetical protein